MFSRRARGSDPGHQVALDERPLRRQIEFSKESALRLRQEHIPGNEIPPGMTMDNGRRHDGQCRDSGCSVAAMQYRGCGQVSADAVMAGRALAEEVSASAQELVVVNRCDYRHLRVPTGIEH